MTTTQRHVSLTIFAAANFLLAANLSYYWIMSFRYAFHSMGLHFLSFAISPGLIALLVMSGIRFLKMHYRPAFVMGIIYALLDLTLYFFYIAIRGFMMEYILYNPVAFLVRLYPIVLLVYLFTYYKKNFLGNKTVIGKPGAELAELEAEEEKVEADKRFEGYLGPEGKGMEKGAIGGIILMVIALTWFFAALVLDRITIYPPILFVVGLVILIMGLVKGRNKPRQ
ncbi:MAG: hypothetical protein GY754_34780 [bacterium]|nr:hypothetical protein [bacterium]